MRHSPARPARAAAVIATTLALGGLSLAGAAPADAVVLDPMSTSVTQIQFNDDPPGAETCTQSGTGDKSAPPMPLVADGLPHTTTLSSDVTDTHDTIIGDVTTATSTTSHTVTVSQADGQLSHISAHDSFTTTINSAKGAAQHCNLEVQAGSMSELAFDLVRPAFVTLSATSRGMLAELIMASQESSLGGGGSTDKPLAAAISGGKHGTSVGHILLPAGTFYIGLVEGVGATQAPNSGSGEAQLEVSFDAPGVALSAATGKGKKYVDLPAGADCTTSTAIATWKWKAGKRDHLRVKKASFKVDGTKVGAVRKPHKKEHTTLRGLPAEGPFTVTGTLKLFSGKTVTVSRDYQACS